MRTAHLYLAQTASGPCVSLFDNNATFTRHNISGLTVLDQLGTVNTAILGVDSGITAVTAHGSSVTLGHSANNVPLFDIGSAGL